MKIGSFDLNTDGTFIIAELSANHGGKIEIAKQTIQAAKDIGANAIKLQTYTADTLTLDCDNEDFIIQGGTLWDQQKLYDLYQQAALPWEWHPELFNYARAIGIDIFSSPFDKTAVDFLTQFQPSAYKIASFEITDYELIRYIASKGKPIIISTGIAHMDEIQEAVNICRAEGNHDIVLLQCSSAYPAALEEANLMTIPNLANTFGVISGFSDHTLGIIAPIVATSLGAQVIEKHFILDKAIGGADVSFSLDKSEFAAMVKAIRDTEKLLGKVDYRMTETKHQNRQFARSLYVTQTIQAGELITKDNIRSIRPNQGLHPKYLTQVLGKKITKTVSTGTALHWNLIEK